jgi:hypothetical protein
LIDITERIATEAGLAIGGRPVPDRIVFKGRTIGHMDVAGPVITDPHFCCSFRPNRIGVYESRIWQLEAHELRA